MSRRLLFVLLVVTCVALAEDKPQTQPAAGAAEAHAKAEAAKGQTEHAQTQKDETQAEPAKTQAEPDETQAEPADTKAQTDESGKLTSVPGSKALGMSILGNQEAPKALVIVPWKSSELGHSPGISPMLDDSRQPVDKEVFMRELRYYQIRSETKP